MSRRLPPSGGSRRLRSPSPSRSRSWCRSTARRRTRDFGPRPSRARRRSPSPARRHRPNRSAGNGNRRLPRRRQARCRRKRRRLHPFPLFEFSVPPADRAAAASDLARLRQAGEAAKPGRCNALAAAAAASGGATARRPSARHPALALTRALAGRRRRPGKGASVTTTCPWSFVTSSRTASAARTGSAARQSGRVVSRVTLARDGRLIDVSIDTSSGRPAIDAAELAAIRQASPFPPGAAGHAGRPGDPGAADELLGDQAKSAASAWRTAGDITAIWL